MTTLGPCCALLPGDKTCRGQLIVEREVAGIAEATCDQCGYEAAAPRPPDPTPDPVSVQPF